MVPAKEGTGAMTRDEPEISETQDSGVDGDSSRFHRRSVLMALGAGSSIGLATQYGRLDEHEEGEDGTGEGTGTETGGGTTNGQQCTPCIDSYSGYLQAAEMKEGGQELAEISPVETVELRVTDADVVFPEEGEGAQENGTAGTETGTPFGTDETGTPWEDTETGTGTPWEETGTETGTPAEGTGTETTGTPMGGEDGAEGFPDFYFDPVGLSLQPGDTVEFVVREELHTVTAYHPRFLGFQQRVPEGVPGFSSPPFLMDDSWYYRFDEPGVYDLLCLPHEGLGMVMRVVVTEEGTEEAPEAYPEPEPGTPGPSPIALTVLSAPELDPQNVVDQGSVAWTDLSDVSSEPPFGG